MLARDWIGMKVEVIESPNPCEVGIKGEVVDETMNTLKVKTEKGVKTIIKKGRWFKVYADKVYKVKGDLINFRPEERIMRGIIMLKKEEGSMVRDIGLNVKAPEKECDDKNCPFHGNLSVRGQILTGRVVKSYMKTAVIERELIKYVPKYERYMKKRSKLHAHNPPCIDAKPGDIVTIAECRPISKTKSFVIVEVKR